MYLKEVLKNYIKQDIYPFHMPGHKRQCEMVNPYLIDMTEVAGVDDLHDPEGPILKEQERIAYLYGSDKSYILVGGSTVGNLAAVYAAFDEGEKVLIQRNSHKSIYNAVTLRHLKVDYIDSQLDENGIYMPGSIEAIKEAVGRNKDVKGIILTSPSYEGLHCDIEQIAEFCDSQNIILIIDQAHGAHLGFNGSFKNGAAKYADITIQSLHKTLPALTQTAVLHVKRQRIDIRRIQEALDIFETSSPSYVLMNSVSQCMEKLEAGEYCFEQYVDNLSEFYRDCEQLQHIKILQENVEEKDPGKIVILTTGTNISGKQLADLLRNQYKIETELSSFNYVIAMTSFVDGKEAYKRLSSALLTIDKTIKNGKRTVPNISIKPQKAMEPWEAKKGQQELVSLKMSKDRISAEMVCIYPPGSPIVVPGEIITEEVLSLIEVAKDQGLHVTGVNDGVLSVVKY